MSGEGALLPASRYQRLNRTGGIAHVRDRVRSQRRQSKCAGRAHVLDAVESSVAGAKTVHQVHMPEVEIDGDKAQAIWAVQERVVLDNGTSLTAYGLYHARWVRVDGQWKIAVIRLTQLIMDFV